MYLSSVIGYLNLKDRPQPLRTFLNMMKTFIVLFTMLSFPAGALCFVSTRASLTSRPTSSFVSPRTVESLTSLDLFTKPGIELSNLFYDSTSTAFDAWEWTANLGAPAALVAGAVLVTLSETRQDLAPRGSDQHWVRIVKQMTRFLLLSSFALEVVSIFVSTMTGTVLLSHGEVLEAAKAVGYTSPLALMHHHHEFEYLTIQLGFLQGLIHWLGAVALEFLVPKGKETVSARRMNQFMASCLVTLIFWIMAFYNHHLTFYCDYLDMVRRYAFLFVKRYFRTFRPMSLLYVPSTITSFAMGWRAFQTEPHLDDD